MVTILNADVIDGLSQIQDESVHCVVTSPPYHGLRDYGIPPRLWGGDAACDHDWLAHDPAHKGQVEQTKWKQATAAGAGGNLTTQSCFKCGGWLGVLGQEPTLAAFIQHLVEVFREVRRVLHPTGTLWVNMGDSYQHNGPQPSTGVHRRNGVPLPETYKREKRFKSKKQLGMVPARLAIAMQEDEWILRNDIIWAKGLSFCPSFSGSVMPESIQDRCTWSHEHMFHFAKNDRYYYDINGCREPYADSTRLEAATAYTGEAQKDYESAGAQNPSDVKRRVLASVAHGGGRNLRNVWVVPKQPLKEAHFAAFPEKLVEPVIKLATSEKGVCPQCGNQWERVMHKEAMPQEVKDAFEASRAASAHDTGRADGYTARKPNFRRRILGEGWRPTCQCDAGDPIPATVLDPFSGSGRAGIVSKRLGRTYIGIDASAEYCAIARRVIDAS